MAGWCFASLARWETGRGDSGLACAGTRGSWRPAGSPRTRPATRRCAGTWPGTGTGCGRWRAATAPGARWRSGSSPTASTWWTCRRSCRRGRGCWIPGTTPEEFTDAKAAYLADWNAGGQAETFARWIAAAFDAHARRSTGERVELARETGRAEERTGSTRSICIPTDTVTRMRAAITADQKAGRWPSNSGWCGDAIAAAVNHARQRDGGHLPTPPSRLPNLLAR